MIEEKAEEVAEKKEEEAYKYRANDEETCEEVAAEDEADAEAYYRENGLVKESGDAEEAAEDTKSIVSVFATVGDESKTVFKAGEALTNEHTGSEVENFDIDGKGQVVEGDSDKVSLSGSIRSVKSVKSRSGSIKSTTGSVRSVKSITGSVRSVQSVKERQSILEESIFKTQDVEVENDNVSMKSRTGSVQSNRSSVRSVQSVKERPSILEDSVFNNR